MRGLKLVSEIGEDEFSLFIAHKNGHVILYEEKKTMRNLKHAKAATILLRTAILPKKCWITEHRYKRHLKTRKLNVACAAHPERRRRFCP